MSPIATATAGWYNLFYTLAVVVAGSAMFDTGRRRGWGLVAWSIAAGAWAAGGIIGALLPRLVLGDLVAARTAIGAVTIATLALALAARTLRINVPDALDTTAVAIPLGASIVRIGCYLAECCQGLATTLPIGIAQHADDIPRHPVQLYEASLEALLAFAIVRRKDWPARPGARILTSMAAMTTIRFVTEFVRDNEKFAGLSLAQWIVLPVAIACVALLAGGADARRQPRVLSETGRRVAITGAGLVTLAFLTLELPPIETATLTLVAIAGAALLARRICRLAPTGLAVLALQMPPVTADTTYPRDFNFKGVGFTGGSFDRRHTRGDCESGTTEDWRRHYTFSGIAAEAGSRREISATRARGLRARGYLGMQAAGPASVRVGSPADPQGYRHLEAGVTVAADADWEWFGISYGVSLGDFAPMSAVSGEPGEDMKIFPLMPVLGMRVGPAAGLSVEARVGDEVPTWSPGPTATLTAALGDRRGNRIRIGASEVGGFFLAANIRRSNLEIIPSINRGRPSDYDASNVAQASIMIRKWIRVSPPRPVER